MTAPEFSVRRATVEDQRVVITILNEGRGELVLREPAPSEGGP